MSTVTTVTNPSYNDDSSKNESLASLSSSCPEELSEDALRKQLRLALKNLNMREPLDPTYKTPLYKNLCRILTRQYYQQRMQSLCQLIFPIFTFKLTWKIINTLGSTLA